MGGRPGRHPFGIRRRAHDDEPANGDHRRAGSVAHTYGGTPGRAEANGWRNAARKPVANADLWAPLVALVKANPVTFAWVRGHSGDRLNDLVDGLAVAAIGR